MIKFKRSFNGTVIRMVKIGENIYYSAYDIATALNFADKRRAVNETVIAVKGEARLVDWDGQSLFISDSYVVALSLRAEWALSKNLVVWVLEIPGVAKRFNTDHSEPSESMDYSVRKEHYATTQIAKLYGMSAKELNEILHKNEIQYKVNDQWVLYSKYQNLDLTKVVRVKKNGTPEMVLHTYWTELGIQFIEDLMRRLGYQQHGQLSLF